MSRNVPVEVAELLGLNPREVLTMTIEPSRITATLVTLNENGKLVLNEDRELVTRERVFNKEGVEQ